MSGTLDRFFGHYYGRRPVNATFTGVHAHDDRLPDWSPRGLESLDDEMHALARELSAAHPAARSAREYRDDPQAIDAELAHAFLEVQLAENASLHGVRGNPSVWTGEAVFAIVSLMNRDFAPMNERIDAAAARLEGIPMFLEQARETIGDHAIPAPWMDKALRECEGGLILLGDGIDAWLASGPHSKRRAERLRAAADLAREGLMRCGDWLSGRAPAPHTMMGCGAALFDVLLARGHQSDRPRSELLEEARLRFVEARRRLSDMARETAGSWAAVQAQLAADHPDPANYLRAFAATWEECHEVATSRDVLTWPDWPIRYRTIPPQTRDAAPYLYYLYYRSPAPFDPYDNYDYVVPPLPLDPALATTHLRAWNYGAIKLNHVIHHGGIGHHLQNWHAYHRARSRIGKVAAVDCANRIGMFSGGTMAEGWACYATELMEELGFLTPLERVAQQHSRVRFLGRAIIDIELHQRTMSFEDAVAFCIDQIGMTPDVAHAEVVKMSMYPCTGLMYWLGTQGILDLRKDIEEKRGSAFSLKAFHDEVLGHGSIPVPLIARMMTADD